MILGMHEAETQFITVCLAEMLRKVEGRVFLSEEDVLHIDHDTTVSIHFDDQKKGWWVSLHDPGQSGTHSEREPATSA